MEKKNVETKKLVSTLEGINPLFQYNKLEKLKDFEPETEDIIGPEFTPPYRFIFGKEDWSPKEAEFIKKFKEEELYGTLEQPYWNDRMLLRCLIK
jgi:hypothetical protein